MNTESKHILTLDKLLSETYAWYRSSEGDGYHYIPWDGVGAAPEVEPSGQGNTLTLAELAEVDPRLPVLLAESFKVRLSPQQRNKQIQSTVRFWSNQHPMPFGRPLKQRTFIDSVSNFEYFNEDASRIKLHAVCVDIIDAKGVSIVKQTLNMSTIVDVSDVEPYFPDFKKRLAVAEGLELPVSEKMAFIFPRAPKVNELFHSTTTPTLPDFT